MKDHKEKLIIAFSNFLSVCSNNTIDAKAILLELIGDEGYEEVQVDKLHIYAANSGTGTGSQFLYTTELIEVCKEDPQLSSQRLILHLEK